MGVEWGQRDIKDQRIPKVLFQLTQTRFLGINGFEVTSKSISVHIYISPNLATTIADSDMSVIEYIDQCD